VTHRFEHGDTFYEVIFLDAFAHATRPPDAENNGCPGEWAQANFFRSGFDGTRPCHCSAADEYTPFLNCAGGMKPEEADELEAEPEVAGASELGGGRGEERA
jgi:hypothetical protein